MTKSICMRFRTRIWTGGIGLLSLPLLLLGSVTAASASPRPAFELIQNAVPTVFTPGSSAPEVSSLPAAAPQYSIAVHNVGGAVSSGEVTVTDTLPAGVTPSTVSPPAVFTVPQQEYSPCGLAGQTVTCTVGANIATGEEIVITLPVDVSAGVSETVTNHVSVVGGGASPVESSITTTASSSSASFGFLSGDQGFSFKAVNADGTPATQAGSHPFSLVLDSSFPIQKLPGAEPGDDIWGAGTLRDLLFRLPKGVVINGNATSRCTEAELTEQQLLGGCPPGSEIGVISLLTNLANVQPIGLALYNMVPPPGEPVEFAFELDGTFVHVHGGLNGDFTLGARASEIVAKVASFDVSTVLWGDPSSPAYDATRLGEGCAPFQTGVPCPVERRDSPLITMPSACSGPLTAGVSADSWEEPSNLITRTALSSDLNGNPVGIEGCSKLAFKPTVTVLPDSQAADSPSGLSVDIKAPQSEGINSLASATLKKTVVQLPRGVAIAAPAADGLLGCAPAQIGIGTNAPASCPDASKIGEAELTTPLLDKTIGGTVYLAQQNNNPFDSLLADYIVLEGEGVVIKLPGKVELDPATGQITNTFDNNPELPFTDLKVHFDGGSRAALATPLTCGTYQTTTALSPWSAKDPGNPSPAETRLITDPFPISTGPGGGPCTGPGFAPGFSAGVTNPVAGSSSPFVLQLTRHDGEQNVSALTTVLPAGLLAKLADVPLCAEAQAATGACPVASQVGSSTIGVGSGATPLYVPQPGKAPTAVYLAGPYKDAPYSLVIKVPAETDPIDLGTVVVRAAIHVDPHDAHVTVISDPLPQILQGIPLRYRDIRVTIDRPGFMLSPTSCEPMAVTGSAASSNGASAPLSSRFQVGGCKGLPFRPSFSATTASNGNFHGASLDVKITQKPGEAAIHKVDTQLPIALPSLLATLQKACTDVQFSANPAGCPSGSLVGSATASTPILNAPLTGPAYLVSHSNAAFPDLDVVLQGDGIKILLVGNTDIKKGITFSRFETVPDAPISSFELKLPGGRGALLAATKNLCAPTKTVTVSKKVTKRIHGRARRVVVKVKKRVPETLLMPTTITGQNGATVTRATKIGVTGCVKAKAKAKAKSPGKARKRSR